MITAIILTWILFYLVHPTWFLPVALPLQVVFLVSLAAYVAVNGWLLARWGAFEKDRYRPYSWAALFSLKDRELKWLWIFGGAMLAFQAVLMVRLPLIQGSDEVFHSLLPALPFDIIRNRTGVPLFHALSWLAALVVLAAGWAAYRHRSFIARHRNIVMAVLVLALAAWCCLLLSAAGHPLARKFFTVVNLQRYPPLGKMLHYLSYPLLGINLVTARMQSGIFYVLSVIALYRLARLFRPPQFSYAVAVVFGLFPVVFHYGYLSYLDMGLVFFFILTGYFFLKFLRDRNSFDLMLTVLSFTLGYFYKIPLVCMTGVCAVFLLFDRGEKAVTRVALPYFMAAVALPWMAITYLFVERTYVPSSGNLFSLAGIGYRLMHIPDSLTYPVFILFLGGLLVSLVKREKDRLVRFAWVWFIVYYLFITGDWCSEIRLTLPYYPPVAILVVYGIEQLALLFRRPLFAAFAAATALWLAFSAFLVPSLGLSREYSVWTDMASGYYFPSKPLVQFIRERVPRNSTVFMPYLSDTWFPLRTYGMYDKYHFILDVPAAPDVLQSADAFYRYCSDNGVRYVVLPFSRQHRDGFVACDGNFYRHGFLAGLRDDDKRMQKIAQFALYDRWITVWRMSERAPMEK